MAVAILSFVCVGAVAGRPLSPSCYASFVAPLLRPSVTPFALVLAAPSSILLKKQHNPSNYARVVLLMLMLLALNACQIYGCIHQAEPR